MNKDGKNKTESEHKMQKAKKKKKKVEYTEKFPFFFCCASKTLGALLHL